jgi:glycosyltransferase involved in cell wall biosynthesis
MEERVGHNVLGFVSSRLGLGEAARNSVRLLCMRGQEHACLNLFPPLDVSHEEPDPAWNVVDSAGELLAGVNIFHLNPPEADYLITSERAPGLQWPDHVNAIVPFWELPRLPDDWLSACSRMDVVLAPSRFVMDAVQSALPDVRVIHYPQAVYPPPGVVPDRSRWGFAGGSVAFLSAFDLLSDMCRKNPWGAIDAFQAAFPGRDDVLLMVKVNNVDGAHGQDAQYRDLSRRAQEDSRIRLLARSLSRGDLWSLYASADVYVSLHRSEGLGLGPLEAMAVGTPAIATGWSGNMDFMTAENSFPVPFTLVPVGGTSIEAYEGRGGRQQWADPDTGAAAAMMLSLANDPELRRMMSVRAREGADAARAAQTRGASLDELLALHDRGYLGSAEHRLKVRGMVRRRSVIRLKRPVVAALRTLGLKAPALVTASNPPLTPIDSMALACLIADGVERPETP